MSIELAPEVVSSLTSLRTAYADFLTEVPTEGPRAIDLERALGVDKKLAWQVVRIGRDPDPLLAGSRVPGPSSTKRLAAAARRIGVPEQTTQRVVEATQAVHAVMSRYAANASAFDLMVRSVTGDGLIARNLELKQTAFRTNCQLLGKYCETDIFTVLIQPGQEADTIDMCSIRGLVDLCSIRPVAQLEVARHLFDHADHTRQRREPIDPSTAENPIALLTPFCSSPTPEIRHVEGQDGFTRSLVIPEHLGQQSAVTCLLADVTRESPLRGRGNEPRAIGHIHEIATPSRTLIQDVLIHPDLARMPDLRVLTNRRDATRWPGDDVTPLLPIQEEVVAVGRGGAAMSAPEVTNYAAMVGYVGDKLGWNLDSFVLYRTRIAFPVLNSVVWMRFDLEN